MKAFSFIFAICLLLTSFQSYGQLALLRDNGTGNPITINPYSEVKGSQYFGDFLPGTLILKNSQLVSNLMLNLNGYDNTLEYKLEGSLYAYDPEMLPGFILNLPTGDTQEYTSQYVLPNFGEKRFVQILTTGKYSLVNYQYKIMTNDVSANYGAQGARVFQDESILYVVKDEVVHLFKNKPKNLEEIFGTDYAEAKKVIQSQKLDLKEQNDVFRLINYMNSPAN